MYIYIAIGVLAVIIIYVLITYNKLVTLKNMVKEAFSTMDVYLKKRWNLVPNLVECVKGYAKHEQETLDEVIKLRNETAYDSMTSDAKIEADAKIKSSIGKLMMLAESYPELKADKSFRQLSDQLIQIEDDIANSRKYYNGTVKNYNIAILSVPSNIIAKIFRFKEEKMFEISEKEKENVKIELGEK